MSLEGSKYFFLNCAICSKELHLGGGYSTEDDEMSAKLAVLSVNQKAIHDISYKGLGW